ncbi:DUF7285 family protein [Halopiger aswanensis]|uniref:DUF7285 family protein n=1 Tax=Halopiger aswanensis TaxID=148449 RepID=UPI001FE567E6|nr:hypothetical protein [Halopiger aswanensis]
MVLGIGMYAVAYQSVLPGTSQQATADQTIDRIWDELEENGVFYAHDDPALQDRIDDSEPLPAGATVYVSITAIDEDANRVLVDGAFPSGYPDNDASSSDIEQYVAEDGIPDDASVATQSIPVTVENEADVRSGTLRVAVW